MSRQQSYFNRRYGGVTQTVVSTITEPQPTTTQPTRDFSTYSPKEVKSLGKQIEALRTVYNKYSAEAKALRGTPRGERAQKIADDTLARIEQQKQELGVDAYDYAYAVRPRDYKYSGGAPRIRPGAAANDAEKIAKSKEVAGIYRLSTGEVIVSQLGAGTVRTPSGGTATVKVPVATDARTGRPQYAPEPEARTITGFNLFDPTTRQALREEAQSGRYRNAQGLYGAAQASYADVPKAPTVRDRYNTGREYFLSSRFNQVARGNDTPVGRAFTLFTAPARYTSAYFRTLRKGASNVETYGESLRDKGFTRTGNYLMGFAAPIRQDPIATTGSYYSTGALMYGTGGIGGYVVKKSALKYGTRAALIGERGLFAAGVGLLGYDLYGDTAGELGRKTPNLLIGAGAFGFGYNRVAGSTAPTLRIKNMRVSGRASQGATYEGIGNVRFREFGIDRNIDVPVGGIVSRSNKGVYDALIESAPISYRGRRMGFSDALLGARVRGVDVFTRTRAPGKDLFLSRSRRVKIADYGGERSFLSGGWYANFRRENNIFTIRGPTAERSFGGIKYFAGERGLTLTKSTELSYGKGKLAKTGVRAYRANSNDPWQTNNIFSFLRGKQDIVFAGESSTAPTRKSTVSTLKYREFGRVIAGARKKGIIPQEETAYSIGGPLGRRGTLRYGGETFIEPTVRWTPKTYGGGRFGGYPSFAGLNIYGPKGGLTPFVALDLNRGPTAATRARQDSRLSPAFSTRQIRPPMDRSTLEIRQILQPVIDTQTIRVPRTVPRTTLDSRPITSTFTFTTPRPIPYVPPALPPAFGFFGAGGIGAGGGRGRRGFDYAPDLVSLAFGLRARGSRKSAARRTFLGVETRRVLR